MISVSLSFGPAVGHHHNMTCHLLVECLFVGYWIEGGSSASIVNNGIVLYSQKPSWARKWYRDRFRLTRRPQTQSEESQFHTTGWCLRFCSLNSQTVSQAGLTSANDPLNLMIVCCRLYSSYILNDRIPLMFHYTPYISIT